MIMKMTKTPKFSVVIICRNEEATLPRMLASLKEFQERGGEIVCLDTGSSDKTAEVARSMGCKVTEVGDKFKITIDQELADKINAKFVVDDDLPVVNAGESLFDFASARNYAATLSSNDFIFTPDSDEVYSSFNIDKINECI
jgi:glycosyltransferase involved in cell wall biosynthesis